MASSSARTVFGNAGALLVIQITNQILPFILVPYLTRALGLQTYGVVAYGLGIVQLACVLTDYGFALSATLQISRHRDDVRYVNRLIGSVLTCKSLLMVAVSAVVVTYALVTEKYAAHTPFLLLLLLPIAGQTFQPLWFFQGVEKMVYITLFTVASRLLYFVLVLALVAGPGDYGWVAVASGAAQLGAAALGLGLMLRQGYRPVWAGWREVFATFKASTDFFWSRAAAATYTGGGAVFLGLVSTTTQVAYYAAAEQLYRGAQSLFMPLSQALYPNMARTRNFPLLFRAVKWATLLCALGLPVGLLLGDWVIGLLFGKAFVGTLPVLLVFLLTLVITTPSVLLGYPLLGALGQPQLANRSVLIAGGAQVLLLVACYLLDLTQALAVAGTVLAVETVVLVLRARWGRLHYLHWRAAQPSSALAP